jgi:hypothetical protein
MLRALLWDLETRVNDEYERLLKNGKLERNQCRFMQGMVVALAGNKFYSATTSRYAKAAIEAGNV